MFGGALSAARFYLCPLGDHAVYFGVDHYPAAAFAVHPTLAEIKKEGESGRRKISQQHRHGTLVPGDMLQSPIGIATGLPNMPGGAGPGDESVLCISYFTAVVSLVTGRCSWMWLGEQTPSAVSVTVSQSSSSLVSLRTPPAIASYYRASASRRPALPRVAVGCSISICSDVLVAYLLNV